MTDDPLASVLQRLQGKNVQLQVRGGLMVTGKLVGVADRAVHLRAVVNLERRRANGEVASAMAAETDAWHRLADIVGVLEIPPLPEQEQARIVPVRGNLPRGALDALARPG